MDAHTKHLVVLHTKHLVVLESEGARAAPRVVVVEDNVHCRRALKRDLELHGYEVFGAKDGVEAQEVLRAVDADVVVTDLVMPRMDGLELIVSLKATRPDIPVIAISGVSSLESGLPEAQKQGAEEVLAKPFTIERLTEAVHRAIRCRRDPWRHLGVECDW